MNGKLYVYGKLADDMYLLVYAILSAYFDVSFW